jgi:hypothetical protein
MDQQTYIVTFDGLSVAEANRYAEELENILLNATSEIQVQRKRSDARTQDIGTIVEIVLGSSSIVPAVTVIGKWLQSRQHVTLKFKRPEGDVIATNINNKTAVKLTELLLKSSKEKTKE